MIENQLARKVLIKASPQYALRRSTEIIYGWINDMWNNPAKYRAAILTARPEYQPKLNRLLDLYMQCAHIDIHRPPAELESEMLELNGIPDTGSLVETYFQDKPALGNEFMSAIDVVKLAGLYP